MGMLEDLLKEQGTAGAAGGEDPLARFRSAAPAAQPSSEGASASVILCSLSLRA